MASSTEPIAPELLALLRCPETMQPLHPAPAEVIARINRERLPDGSGQPPEPPLEHGLQRADGTLVYPVCDGVPVMLLSSAIPLPA